jgi:hypothetical protein
MSSAPKGQWDNAGRLPKGSKVVWPIVWGASFLLAILLLGLSLIVNLYKYQWDNSILPQVDQDALLVARAITALAYLPIIASLCTPVRSILKYLSGAIGIIITIRLGILAFV